MPTMSAGQERAQSGDGEKALDGRDELEASSYKIIDAIPTIAWCARPDGFNEFLIADGTITRACLLKRASAGSGRRRFTPRTSAS